MAPRSQEARHLRTRLRTRWASRWARELLVLGLLLAAAFWEACGALPGARFAQAVTLHKVFAFFRTFVCVWPAHFPLLVPGPPFLHWCHCACASSARRCCPPHARLALCPLRLRSSPLGSDRARCQPRPLLEVGLRLFPRGGCAHCFKPVGCCKPGLVRSSFALQTLLRCHNEVFLK